MGHIESDNPTRHIWLAHIIHRRFGVIRSNEAGVKYGFMFGLKELLLLKFISQFTRKKNKQTNKQTNKEKEKENKPMLGLT